MHIAVVVKAIHIEIKDTSSKLRVKHLEKMVHWKIKNDNEKLLFKQKVDFQQE